MNDVESENNLIAMREEITNLRHLIWVKWTYTAHDLNREESFMVRDIYLSTASVNMANKGAFEALDEILLGIRKEKQ